MTKHKTLSIFAIALVVTLMAAGALQAQTSRSVFSWVITNRATVQSGGLTVSGATTLDDATVGDDLTVTDDASTNDLIVADFEVVTPQTTLLLTMNGWITPTGTIQPIRSAGAVSVNSTRIAPGSSGQRLTLVNYGSNTVTITETAPHLMAGNFAIGQGDNITMVYSGTAWIELGRSNN